MAIRTQHEPATGYNLDEPNYSCPVEEAITYNNSNPALYGFKHVAFLSTPNKVGAVLAEKEFA